MKITFLGQAGLLFETKEMKILVDPYFSDSVGETDPAKHRRHPVPEEILSLRPDVLLFTHDHLDHFDPKTAEKLLEEAAEGSLLVLGPRSVWEKARQFGKGHNYVLFSPACRWTEGEVVFSAVKACHSDAFSIGCVITAEGKNYYVTGDTLYSEEIFPLLPDEIEAVFLPVNGKGNNMNAADALLFAEKTKAKYAVPIHTGLLDDLSPEIFQGKNRILPEIFKEIKL